MFLRNYDNITILRLFSGAMEDRYYPYYSRHINGYTLFGDGYFNVKNAYGAIAAFTDCGYKTDYTAYLLSMCKNNICLGTGNAPVTYDDYTLSGEIVDNTKLSYVSHNVSYDATTRKVSKTVTYSYTNETESDIKISEWGLFFYNYYKSTASTVENIPFSASTNRILLYREVLDTPVVIEAGTTATLKFTVDIPMSNHP